MRLGTYLDVANKLSEVHLDDNIKDFELTLDANGNVIGVTPIT